MANYVVERQENGVWVPKFRCNFEDESFPKLAQNVTTRILCDGSDITAKYRSTTFSSSADTANFVVSSDSLPMKPAAYKSLSEEDKLDLQRRASELKNNKLRRADILKELNISEATYDTMRADMQTSSPQENFITNEPVHSEPKLTHSTQRRVGLLGRR